MALWWLEPGWGDALCGKCGTNIKSSGGDPDWGFCYDCFNDIQEEKKQLLEHERELRLQHETEMREDDKPRHGDIFWYINVGTDNALEIRTRVWTDTETDLILYNANNCFHSYESASQEATQ